METMAIVYRHKLA